MKKVEMIQFIKKFLTSTKPIILLITKLMDQNLGSYA
jgi:hypothetical protein